MVDVFPDLRIVLLYIAAVEVLIEECLDLGEGRIFDAMVFVKDAMNAVLDVF